MVLQSRMQQLLAIEFAGCEESSRANMAQKIKAATFVCPPLQRRDDATLIASSSCGGYAAGRVGVSSRLHTAFSGVHAK
jgi:hypothetical protein